MAEEALRIVGEVEIGKLNLAPGDVLVIRTERREPREIVMRIHQYAEPFLPPGVKCLIIDPTLELSVLTRAEIEELMAASPSEEGQGFTGFMRARQQER